MPDEYDELRANVEGLEGQVEDLRTIAARLEGEMIYMRGRFAVQQRLDAEEARAVLEVKKAHALERIRDNSAQRNHRRELMIKLMVILTAAVTIVGAILH